MSTSSERPLAIPLASTSMREYYAAAALQGILAAGSVLPCDGDHPFLRYEDAAERAFKFAAAMLAQATK